MDDRRIGTTLQSRYRVDRKLGEGGMGVVYEGEHLLINRRVAIKFLHHDLATDVDAVARFMREAKTASAVLHKNIVEVTDMGQADDGSPYMVLEYLDGRDWAEELSSSELPPVHRVVHIIRQICDALVAAHTKNIVHRDLKPENIFLIERDGDPDFVKVVDFGISKILGDDNNMTKTGMVLGTPYFMSPEQARDSKSVDLRADLYSLGVILFHALTRRFPFESESYASLVVQICTEAPPSAHDLREGVPADLAHIVDVLLAKDPADRFQGAAALSAALAPFADHKQESSAARKELESARTELALSVEARLVLKEPTVSPAAPSIIAAPETDPVAGDAPEETPAKPAGKDKKAVPSFAEESPWVLTLLLIAGAVVFIVSWYAFVVADGAANGDAVTEEVGIEP